VNLQFYEVYVSFISINVRKQYSYVISVTVINVIGNKEGSRYEFCQLFGRHHTTVNATDVMVRVELAIKKSRVRLS